MLASLVMKVAADPFAKVKELIQKLIERLVKEATEEASKKGFCDTEMGKSEHDRDYRLMDVDKLSVELKSLEAKRDGLEEEIESLTADLKALNAALVEATKLREEEKADNMETLDTAKTGLAAVTDAIGVLKAFYKGAAKASALIQEKHSPVDDAGVDAASGSYKGNQEGSKAILGLLDVIKSDFERTIKVTEEMEAKNAAEFVKFDQTTKMDIAGKEMKKKLDKEDLVTTNAKIEKGMSSLEKNMGLLDKALIELEELKPACVDTGMSYAERVQKREDEMAALKKALCMLDADDVEPDCKK
jgi:peptidoglycan hydrolase CwlO-like protein